MIKNRLLVISDIHGCYDEFCKLLGLVKYNATTDQLILLGDYVNRGKDSLKVVQFVYELVHQGAIALKGNHDEWFIKYLMSSTNDFKRFVSEKVGGYPTLQSFVQQNHLVESKNDVYRTFIRSQYKHLIQFLNDLPLIFETPLYVFVHAGVHPKKELNENTSRDLIMSRWGFINQPCPLQKTVIFGHTTCVKIHNKPDLWIKGNKIGIDGGCCFGYQLNCLEILHSGQMKNHFVESKKV